MDAATEPKPGYAMDESASPAAPAASESDDDYVLKQAPAVPEAEPKAAAPAPMETYPSAAPPAAPAAEQKLSIKAMKETIREAGLGVADLLAREDVETRYAEARARLDEAEELKIKKKRRRKIAESSDEDEDDPDTLIPEPTGVKKSKVANGIGGSFGKYAFQEDEEEPAPWMTAATDKAQIRRNAQKGAAHLEREKAATSKAKPKPKKRRGAFADESEPEEEEHYVGNTDDEEEESEDEELNLQSDSGSDIEADDMKSRLDRLAAKKRDKAQRPRATPRLHEPAARVSPEIIDVDREQSPINLAEDLSDGHQTSDEEDDDDDAAHKRAERLLTECGAYASRLIGELQKAGLGAQSRHGALSVGEMGASTNGDFIPLNAAEVRKCCGPNLQLKPHQVVGVNWLLLLERVGANGVLADDMGLGKTIQTIAYLAASRARNLQRDPSYKGQDVIVVPASTLGNWQREFATWCPRESKVVVYHGSQAERAQLRHDPQVTGAHVILTTYTWWERESCEDDRQFFRTHAPWAHVVLDEGHCLRNPDASRSRHLRRLGARSRTVLSGTPIMNRPLDLLSLLLFLMPDLFRDCRVTDRLEEVLKAMDSVGGVKKLRELLAPFCLRRVKVDVLKSLPPKRSHIRSVELDAKQRKAYLSVVGKNAEMGENAEMGDARQQQHLFTALRKAANHPLLLKLDKYPDTARKRVAEECFSSGFFGQQADMVRVTKELETYDDFSMHCVCSEDSMPALRDLCLAPEALYESAKFQELRTLLPDLVRKQGRRVLLFSQWTRLLDLMVELCDNLNLGTCRLDGNTPISERQGMVQAFNEGSSDAKIFLLSTRAGGMGINLTGATAVVLHDVDFNPEVDRQAEDRAHRIGQTKPVDVYRLVAEGTVDRDILDLAARKRVLNERVMASGDPLDEKAKGPDAASVANALAKALDQYRQTSAEEAISIE